MTAHQMKRRGALRLIAPAVLALMIGVTAGCAETDSGAGSTAAGSAAKPDKPEKPRCSNRATDDCTPRVRMGRSVRVDALYWSVTSVRTAAALGDQTYGLGAKADGTFVVVGLRVRSAKDESVTLSDESVQIETADGKKYKADTDGTVAAMGSGDDPMWFDDIGPDATLKTKVVFDLPAFALRKKLSVRFNELGFGSTHGYIGLPRIQA